MTDPIAAAARLLGERAKHDVAIGPLTTYRVGGPAALLTEIGTEDDLRAVAAAVTGSGVRVLPIGRGSNLLVADAARPSILWGAAGNCWQPYVKNFHPHDNSQYNNLRFEDVWLDK